MSRCALRCPHGCVVQGLTVVCFLVLQHNPEQRLTAEQAAQHPWFALHGISVEAVPPTVQSNILPAEDMAARAVLHRSPSSGDFAQQVV